MSGDQNPFYGKSHTDEVRVIMSEKAKQRDMSIYNKKVIQIDKDTNDIIKIWDNISDAAEFIYGDRK